MHMWKCVCVCMWSTIVNAIWPHYGRTPPLSFRALWEPFPGHSEAKGQQLGHECQSSQSHIDMLLFFMCYDITELLSFPAFFFFFNFAKNLMDCVGI